MFGDRPCRPQGKQISIHDKPSDERASRTHHTRKKKNNSVIQGLSEIKYEEKRIRM